MAMINEQNRSINFLNTRLRHGHHPFLGAPEREINPSIRTPVTSCQGPTFSDLLTWAGSKT